MANTTKMFSVDGGEPTTLADFIADNADDPIPAGEVAILEALAVGDAIEMGGGSYATVTVRREA